MPLEIGNLTIEDAAPNMSDSLVLDIKMFDPWNNEQTINSNDAVKIIAHLQEQFQL